MLSCGLADQMLGHIAYTLHLNRSLLAAMQSAPQPLHYPQSLLPIRNEHSTTNNSRYIPFSQSAHVLSAVQESM